MNSFLVEALLKQCPDHGSLFESLSWQRDSRPKPEQVEALTALVERLGSFTDNSDNLRNSRVEVHVENVIWSQCLPLLANICSEPVLEEVKSKETVAAVCKLVKACLPLSDAQTPDKVAQYVLSSLQFSGEDLTSSAQLSAEVASEILAVLLPTVCVHENLELKVLLQALSCVRTLPDAHVSKVSVRILLALLQNCSSVRSHRLRLTVLDDLCTWHWNESTPVVTGRVLLCLAALSDHVLTPDTVTSDPQVSAHFFKIVQDGLTHKDSLARKRALFILKICVARYQENGLSCQSSKEDLFVWDSNSSKLLRDFWEDYVLVMETLEENQIHVVRPVLNRIDSLIQTVSDTKGRSLLHPSWLLCVYQRMFNSENKALMKEGVCHLLQLQVLQQPEFAQAFAQFVIGPFLDVLSETSLFQRAVGQSVGECPELGSKLEEFLLNFFNHLPSEEKASVLLQLIQQLASKQWCAVPVLFISQALSGLCPRPLLESHGLAALREVLRCAMITHQVLLRGAAQCFLLNSALCLTDVSAVTLDDVFGFLLHFRFDESFCRGTKLWHQVCVWLRSNESGFKSVHNEDQDKESVKMYVQRELCNYLKVPPSAGEAEKLPDVSEAARLARAVLLCADMETERDVDDVFQSLLSPLLETLSRVSTNIYLPLKKSDKSLQLVLQLLMLSGVNQDKTQDDKVLVAMKNHIFKVLEPIFEFVVRQLCGQLLELYDIERAEMYLCVLKKLVITWRSVPPFHCTFQQTYFPKIISFSLKVLTEPRQQNPSVSAQVARVVAMASLACVCGLVEQEGIDTCSASELKTLNENFYNSMLSDGCFNEILLKPSALDVLNDKAGPEPVLQNWGRVVARYLSDQWICLSVLLRTLGIPESLKCQSSVILRTSVTSATEGLSLVPSNFVLPIFTYLETALPLLVEEDESLCVDPITLSWDLVQGLSTNPLDFWPSLKGFISMTFQRKLLVLTDTQAPDLTAAIKKIASELMELSQSKSGLFGVLVQHCCELWRPTGQDRDSVFESVFTHMNILIEACVFGPVMRRDQRLLQDVQSYVEHLGDECAANVLCGENRDDQLPRVCALSLLSQLDPVHFQHQKLMQSIVLELLTKDKHISSSKVRYYSNSIQHRVKNRIWQTLLILLPRLSEEHVGAMLSRVFEAGFCSNQASVKYLIEWTMILILTKYPQHMESFWACFEVEHDKTKVSICTFLSVLVNFNVILPQIKDQVTQLRKALDVILQCCFNHNFSVRLYALLALKRVWSLAEDRDVNEEGADCLRSLSSVITACLHQAEAMQSTGNANKNWIRIQEHFFFGAFHPVRDYSLETVLYTFPSLSDLADDEWIPPWKFQKLPCFSHSLTCPLLNPASDLRELNPGDWTQQDKCEQDKEERWAEVQKKITPWKLDIQETELELQLIPQQRAARVGKTHGALLVVASLIDKPTNLGGLCRTCEIFGASALVLDSLRHINDKQFQSLSVTSERWLPLLEVKPVELADFLQLKKSDGYCIVGVEQTANSQSLESYHFPEKTLLLLGNEREGIPANLLQLLDVCVEIPQLGVIRSLNVHVSAALLIWEYTRQHLISGSKAK